MSDLIPFSFENTSIRVINHTDGSFSVVAKDVAEALGYVWKGTSGTISHVPEEWRGVCSVQTPSGIQEMATLAEQGLYFFLGRSDKPKALPFQMWLYGNVVPSIRQTGSYALTPAQPTAPANDRFMIEHGMRIYPAAVEFAMAQFGLNANQARLSADTCVRKALSISVLDYFGQTHLLADERGRVYTPTELGKLMVPPMTAVKVNQALEAAGLQKREMGGWSPTEAATGLFEWSDTNKRHGDGAPVKQLRWFKTVLDILSQHQQQEAA